MGNIGYDPMDRAGLQAWLRGQEGGNGRRRERLLRNLPTAMTELTPRQREILEMHIYNNMNVTDIAAALGINKSTVSRSLHRTFRRLERYLRYSF